MAKIIPTIAEAVATAVQSRNNKSQSIQTAMANAVHKASLESTAIWGRQDLSTEEKQKQIAAITHPDAIKLRILKARDVARGMG